MREGPAILERMFEALRLQDTPIAPALLLAPMAGVTNAPFRRLLSDFGGYGALTTEMLSATAFLQEDVWASPFTKRRPCEGPVIYQFRVSGTENLEAMVAKALELAPTAIDLNLGCPAPKIQQQASGAALWRDFPRLGEVLARLRKAYAGPLTVKCRLGDAAEDWRTPFRERLRLFEDSGVDALTVHPRFSDEKLKRRARWELFPWIAAQTRLPVVGNGDVCAPSDVAAHQDAFAPLAGLMLGRVAAVRPWIFRDFAGLPPVEIDHAEVWERLYRYTLEDMPPERAFGRLKEFTYYFSRNFFFGHDLWRGIQKADDPAGLREAALRFLEARPRLSAGSSLNWA